MSLNNEDFMDIACSQMFNSSESALKVGCVLVKNNEVISYGYKTKNIHAERMAIEDAIQKNINIKGSTLFTTLEPCINLSNNQHKKSCCELIEEYKIKEVFIGSYDPNPLINRKGWKYLKNKKIKLIEFEEKYTKKILECNQDFENYFNVYEGNEGTGKVNHKDNGEFQIITRDKNQNDIIFQLKWTLCGKNCAYTYAVEPFKTAHANYATEFEDVKNSLMYSYSHSVRIPLNEIGIFDHPKAIILVKPVEIQSGPDYGDENFFVKFKYLVRFK